MKNKTKTKDIIIKALSLGIGLAISLVLIAKVAFEMSWNSEIEEVGNVYAIYPFFQRVEQDPIDYTQIPGGVAPGFQQYVPGVEAATRITFYFENDRFQTENRHVITARFVFADTSFFKVFPTEILAGDPSDILSEWGGTMVSRSFAEKITGKGKYNELIGHTICNEDQLDLKFTVSGVFEDFPKNCTVADWNVITSMETYPKSSTENWIGNDRYKGWVRLADGVHPEDLAEAIQDMVVKNLPITWKELTDSGVEEATYKLKSVRKVHLEAPGIKYPVIILSIVAFLLILISVMNCILITVSAMVRRSKEIGVKKCMGAEKGNIYAMLFGETAVSLLLSLVLVALIFLIFRPFIENILGLPLVSILIPQTWIITAAILLIVLVLLAVVPGYLYARITVSVLVRKYDDSKRKWKLGLLFVQLFINIVLIVLLIFIMSQYRQGVKGDMGYSYDRILYFNVRGVDDTKVQSCLNELKALPEVVDIERSYGLPINGSSGDNIYSPDGTTELFNVADQYDVSEGFLDLMEIEMLEGSSPKTEEEMAISKSLLDKLEEYDYKEWKGGMVGKILNITGHAQPMMVTGVYEDYMIGSILDMDDRPSVVCGGTYLPNVVVKVQEINAGIIGKVSDKVNSIITEKKTEVIPYSFLVENSYRDHKRISNSILAGVIFSILIAFFGLIGYVRDESQRRSKEMAIRKINGATGNEILRIFIVDILKILAFAVVLGDILVYFVAGFWLQQFAVKVSLSAWYFIVGDLVIIAIAVATVALCARHISRANPVDSLQDE